MSVIRVAACIPDDYCLSDLLFDGRSLELQTSLHTSLQMYTRCYSARHIRAVVDACLGLASWRLLLLWPPDRCLYGVSGLWDFTEAYFNNASAAAYPPASRALAMKNGVLQRIPPPAERDQMVRSGNSGLLSGFLFQSEGLPLTLGSYLSHVTRWLHGRADHLPKPSS